MRFKLWLVFFLVVLLTGLNFYEAKVIEYQQDLIHTMIKNPSCTIPEAPKPAGRRGRHV